MTDFKMSITTQKGDQPVVAWEIDDPARAEAINWVYNELVSRGDDYLDKDKRYPASTLQEIDDAGKCHGMCATETHWRKAILESLFNKISADPHPDVSFTYRMLVVAATALAAAEARIRMGER